VIVATPTSTHFACAQCAVGRDVHRFVEKPLTLSPAESRALSELVIRRRRI
jgi:predicted dehydrogenase